MKDVPDLSVAVSADPDAVDGQHPWLGLASFGEHAQAWFHGRDDEIAELARRVQRKLLTVLFGQSGLGKTSILRAGLVPRLRPQGYCPVYVRIDYARDAPPPAEQIKQAIYRETRASGWWTQPGVATEGESLWEFLHHRNDMLHDASGRTLTPLLIFDQFEEVFTLAQADDAGRGRAAEFLGELADLVENRPPKALEARLDDDDTLVDRFDFARGDYRILIALREDYLAHAEALKAMMPSVTQNRMRLARMTGEQALDAVLKPGASLVSREVAESIVRFVAGGAELRNAEVEPSLLSLICRELNNARVAQGRREITADLLAGSHATILQEFYARALADQPPGVHRFIEEALLTESGFRENIAEERVRRAFADAGAAPDALSRLVDRRLLRIEERLDVRRVELTHDVLCAVVRASRDLRHEREARDAAVRQLAQQREREAATHRALVRTRQVAAGAGVLAVVAVAGAAFGWVSTQRAQRAEAAAEQSLAVAQKARGESERLVVYLLDDFYRELEPVGRLDLVGELAQRAIGYYDGLPPALRSDDTQRNRALAQARYGAVRRWQSRLDEAGVALDDAVKSLDALRTRGDTSEATAVGLTLALVAQARRLGDAGESAAAFGPARRAVELVAPFASAPDATPSARRAHGAALTHLGFMELRDGSWPASVPLLELARRQFRSIDGLAADADAAANFAIASSWLVEALIRTDRPAEAKQAGDEAKAVADAVLARNPTHMLALRGAGLVTSSLATIAYNEMRQADRLALTREGARAWIMLTRVDPTNSVAWNNLGGSLAEESYALASLGRMREALASVNDAALREGVVERTMFHSLSGVTMVARAAFLAADQRQDGLARALREAGAQANARAIARRSTPDERALVAANWDLITLEIDGALDEWPRVHQHGPQALARAAAIRPEGPDATRWLLRMRRGMHREVGRSALQLGDPALAATHFRAALSVGEQLPGRLMSDRRELASDTMHLAMSLARSGERDEARRLLAPLLAMYRELHARGSDDRLLAFAFARILVAAAVADPPAAGAHLAEAQRLLDALPAEMRALRSTSWWQRQLAETRASRSG